MYVLLRRNIYGVILKIQLEIRRPHGTKMSSDGSRFLKNGNKLFSFFWLQFPSISLHFEDGMV